MSDSTIPTAPPPANGAPLADALVPGSVLGEFELIRVLGAGGFGIVYLALDRVLLRQVAIKEYLPTTLAGRGAADQISLRTESNASRFASGLESFINEARLLASFDHPSLVKVHRFWKANGTAYMAMPYYPGQTLKEARRSMGMAPDEAWLRRVIDPLLGALEALHAQGVYHRDIAPDNILLPPDSEPVLLDFGSARRVIGDQTQSLTAILKPNFAPVEQYADEAGMRQGPYTDLYALGATVHFMLTGNTPMPAVMRAVRDTMPLLAGSEATAYPGVSRTFLQAIDWALALSSTDRPQNAAALRRALDGEVQPPAPTPRLAPASAAAFSADDALAKTEAFPRTQRVTPAPPAANAMPKIVLTRHARHLRGAAAAAMAIGLLGIGGWAFSRHANAPVAEVVAAVAPAVAPAPAALASVQVPAPAAAPAPTPIEVVTPAPTPAALVVEPPAALPAVAGLPKPRAVAVTTPMAASPPTPRTADTLQPPARRTAHAADASNPVRAAPSPALSSAAPINVARAESPARNDSGAPARLCANVGFFAAVACLNRTCQLPAFKTHPQCVEASRVVEQRQRRMEQ
jgi:serine/threonine protein kinase